MGSNLKEGGDAGMLKVQLSYLANSYYVNYKATKGTLKKHGIIKRLRRNKDIIITHPDKGEGVVILNKVDYNRMLNKIIEDKTKFKLLNKDPTVSREKKLQRYLLNLKKKNAFTIVEYKDIYPVGSNIAKIYGTPKMHKFDKGINNNDMLNALKLRPIISSINTYNYNLAKYLTKKLMPYIPKEHCAKDTFTFVEDISKLKHNDQHLISYDVVSLFTNIPLHETINLAVDLIIKNEPKLKISKKELKQLFLFATAETHFLFEGEIYDQTDGVAMGSPLAPVLANLFMGYHENNWINDYQGIKPNFYKRYVDDIFCLFNKKEDAALFLEYLNKQHSNIKFTDESEINGSLPFLDVKISRGEEVFFHTSVFHKLSYTGLLTNFLSFIPSLYKISLVKTLINRVYKICNNWSSFHSNIKELKYILQRNKFPPKVIDKEIKKYLNKVYELDKTKVDKEVNYYKLPYLGDVSKYTQTRIRELCDIFCKDLNITLSFNTCKIGSFLSSKSKSVTDLQSLVVYCYNCPGCEASYVGQTTRHYAERVKEHLLTDKQSHIYKHINNKDNVNCKQLSKITSFKVIDRANSEYTLKIKEAIHIKWLKPTLNTQKYHLNLTLSI